MFFYTSFTLLKAQYLKMPAAAPLYRVELLRITKSCAFQDLVNPRELEKITENRER
jgi:hypothetical protein